MTRVALLAAVDSFERFYGDGLGLDRATYVRSYRNDFVWNYAAALARHGVEVLAYIPSLEGSARMDAPDGFRARFVAVPPAWDRLRFLVQRARTPVERYAGEALHARLLLPDLRRALAEDAVDVLYVQEYWTGRFDVLVRAAGLPVVAGEHGGSSGRHVHLGKGASLRRAAAITVQSSAEERRLRNRYGVRPHRVTNGVDVGFFTPGEAGADPHTIVVVARLDDGQKRISDLIAAVALLPAPWRLEVVGAGPDEQLLRERTQASGAASRVEFVGWERDRAALRERLRRATVFALPSTWEAFTLAALEAMACGTPAVLTPLPPFRDLIEDGVNGVLVPSGNPPAIAAAVQRVAAERDRFSAAARATVVERFSRAETMRRLATILHEAAGKRRPAPLEVVDGNIRRADEERGPIARLRTLPRVRAALELPPVRHAASARAMAMHVRERARFATNELRGATGAQRYHLRDSDLPVLIRHGTEDAWTFNEVFVLGFYEPPPAAERLLAGRDRPLRVLDLGGNIGLSAAFFATRFPAARIATYEPDPENLALLREVARAGGWEVVPAAAGTSSGTARFLTGRFNESRVASPGEDAALEVKVEDILPRLAHTDLLKMDIEGGEWAILADPRFGATPVVVLEYHPQGAPGPDTHSEAARLLEERGYEVVPVFQGPDGVGMAWAVAR